MIGRWMLVMLLGSVAACNHTGRGAAQLEAAAPAAGATDPAFAYAYINLCLGKVQSLTFNNQVLQAPQFEAILDSASSAFSDAQAALARSATAAGGSPDARLSALNDAVAQAAPALDSSMPVVQYLQALERVHGVISDGLANEIVANGSSRDSLVQLAKTVQGQLATLNAAFKKVEAATPAGAKVGQVLAQSGYYSGSDSADDWRAGANYDSDTDSDAGNRSGARGR